jgi:hypothetical protein
LAFDEWRAGVDGKTWKDVFTCLRLDLQAGILDRDSAKKPSRIAVPPVECKAVLPETGGNGVRA